MKARDWRRTINRRLPQLLGELRPAYGIEALQPLCGQHWNACFHARSNTGDMFVKVINVASGEARPLEDLDLVARVTDRLRRAGLELIPRPVRSLDGAYRVRCGESWALAQEWIESDPVDARLELGAQERTAIVQGARCLFEFHRGTAGEQEAELGKRTVRVALTPSAWRSENDMVWQKSRSLLRQRGQNCVAERLAERAQARCRDWLASEHAMFEAEAERVVLHGDFRPENLVWGREGVRAICDLDAMHTGPPEADVAYGALAFSGPRWLIGPRDWSARAAFHAAYDQARHSAGLPALAPERVAAATYYVVLRALSLSFKREQFESRLELLEEVHRNLGGAPGA
jgi:Ser/Thr protein kinase RdoA (MazF antagonist)